MVVSSSVFYVASLGVYAFLHMTESSIWLLRHHTLFVMPLGRVEEER